MDLVDVILGHYNIVNNYYQQDSRVLYIIVPNNRLVNR